MKSAPTRRSLFSQAAGLLAQPLLRAARTGPLNVIFILIDDMGWTDLSCYGSRFYETPNIDRLAAGGMRFTEAYAACPVCSPTRASIMTGKYPARLHLTDWIPGRRQWPAAKLLTPEFEQQLPLAEVTIAEALKPLGYKTASIGKWHLGGPRFYPDAQGFDLNIGGSERGSPSSYFGPFEMPGLHGGSADEYLTERLTVEAERFLEQHRNEPFFLYLPEFAVHIPLQARQKLVEKYRAMANPEAAQNDPVYAAMVESVDEAVGRLVKKVEDLGIAGHTAIFLTGDNGGLRFEGRGKRAITSNAPLRAGKGHLYEGGIREPLIVHWPGVTRPGSTCHVPVCSIDFLPTIVEMAGRRDPPAGNVDGLSLAPLLAGKGAPKRNALFWHYPHYSNQGGKPGGAVRQDDWKLIEFYEDDRLELYNVREDIGERVNLVRRNPGIAARMQGLLHRWRDSVHAAMPVPNPHYDPAKEDQELTGAEPKTAPSEP